MGLKGIDLLGPKDFPTLKKHGLVCTMSSGGGNLNDKTKHDEAVKRIHQAIEANAEYGFPNVIAMAGNRNGIPDEAAALVDQFASWIGEGVMRTLDGSLVYSDRLADVTLPLLVIAAARDLQRPARSVRAAHDAFGSTDKTFVSAGVADGFSVDFGHDDLLAGLASPREVFPLIGDWIAERGNG